MFDWYDDAAESVSEWLGGDAPTHDAATAQPGEGPATEANAEGLWGRIGQTVGDIGRGISQEGIGGVLDPLGMLDRQQAQRDLSNRFEVLDDDFVGPRQHNQVSQAEYEEIARTYSNIRMGRGDLTMDSSSLDDDTDRQEWEDGMMNSVADMMMTTSGRRQVMGISNNTLVDDAGNARLDDDGDEIHRHTTMRPDLEDDGSLVTDNAGVGRAGSNSNDEAFYQLDDEGNISGRGMGTDANLFINPNLQVDDCNRTDVVLAHEMQHVQNRTQGTMVPGDHVSTQGELDSPDDAFRARERQAVGLPTPFSGHYPGDADGCTENTYREERNQLNPNERLLPRTHYRDRLDEHGNVTEVGFTGTASTVDENEQAWADYHRNFPNAR